jgi:hypothetical protein
MANPLRSSTPTPARNPLLSPTPRAAASADPIGPLILRRKPSPLTKKTARILRTRTAAAMLEDWQPSQPMTIVTRGQVSLSDLVVTAADTLGAPHCILSAWCGAPEHYDFLLNARAAGRFASLALILDRFIASRTPEAVEILRRELGPDRLAITRTRARYALLWTDAAHMAIISSADLTRNVGLELHTFDPSPELFDFLAQLSRDIFIAHTPPADKPAAISAQFDALNE